MKHFSTYLLTIIVFIISLTKMQAQGTDEISQLIEDIVANQETEIDESEIYNRFLNYLEEPLNINIASKEQLEELIILNDFQIASLLDYRKKNGQLLSLYEISYVFGFSEDIIKQLKPFISVENIKRKSSLKMSNIKKYNKSTLLLRTQQVLENQAGYKTQSDSLLALNPNSVYMGNPQKLLAKYKFKYSDKIEFGFTAENDAGEELFKGSNTNGFDFYSAHLTLKNIRFLKTLVLGDFQTEYGQGLISWSNLSFGKSVETGNLRQRAKGLHRYSSSNENQFMRGAGATLKFSNFELGGFYSYKKLDANLVYDTINNNYGFSSLPNSGYHRTLSEIDDKNAVKEYITGGQISYKKDHLHISASYISYWYNKNYLPSDKLYKIYSFNGFSNSNASVDYHFHKGKISLFGEEAYSFNGAFAFLNGINAHVSELFSIGAIHRYYEQDYQANYSNAFGEMSSNANEQGFYLNITSYPFKGLKVSAYIDVFESPWMKFQTSSPSSGSDFMLDLKYSPSSQFNTRLRFKRKNGQKDYKNESINSLELQEFEASNLQLDFNIIPNAQFKAQSRLAMAWYNNEFDPASEGIAFYQNFTYKFIQIPLVLDARYAYFDTDSYDTRIYTYERDVLYSFSVPALYGQGHRYYLNIHYKVKNWLGIWLRYSQSYYNNKEAILTGLDEITGNTKSEIKLQLQFKF